MKHVNSPPQTPVYAGYKYEVLHSILTLEFVGFKLYLFGPIICKIHGIFSHGLSLNLYNSIRYYLSFFTMKKLVKKVSITYPSPQSY